VQDRHSSPALKRRDHLFLLLPLLLVTGPFLLWPVIFGFFASFTSFSPFTLHPRFTGLANYASLIGDGYFRAAFRTVAVFSVSAVALELAIGTAVAWLLREPFRGRGVGATSAWLIAAAVIIVGALYLALSRREADR
jgi:multiple sugar transport system permease protein